MTLLNSCKTKEFAAGTGSTITIISILMFSVIIPGMAEQDNVNLRQDEAINKVTLQLAQNNVPELKEFVKAEFAEIKKGQKDIQADLHQIQICLANQDKC